MRPIVFLTGLAVSVALVLYAGSWRWQKLTDRRQATLAEAGAPLVTTRYDPAELAELPTPVQGYFHRVLTPGQPIITAVELEHRGRFNLGPITERWRPFHSLQHVVTGRPGFLWDARIRVVPGMRIHVHDAYLTGEGLLQASLFGLIPLAESRGGEAFARAELMRFLAEAPWYPTALLPSQGVRWTAVDEGRAEATLEDGGVAATLRFAFGANGLIESVRADARLRTLGDASMLTPWLGRWRDYEQRQGMHIPLSGEVAWQLPDGPKPYWRGRLIRIDYEFSP